MQLEKYIANLLKHHNCVIVPDFGGFIANYESAWINHSRALIYPPYKQILFNRNLTQNDGLLAHELVLQHAVSYAEALTQIASQVKNWREQLDAGQRIELEEIGFLFLQNNQVVFEQNREVNLLLQAYGLKQVTFVDYAKQAAAPVTVYKPESLREKLRVVEKKPLSVRQDGIATADMTSVVPKGSDQQSSISTGVNQSVTGSETPVISLNTEEKIELIETEPSDEKVVSIHPESKKSRNYKYAVAAAVVLPALFYAYWIPMKTDFLNTGKIQVSDFNPFNTQARSVYQYRESDFAVDLNTDWKSWEELTGSLPEHVAVYNLELTEDLYVPVRLEGVDETKTFNSNAAFHLIAGCFSVKSNAENLVEELTEKGYTAGIVDKNKGLYRVSAGAFNSENDADTAKDQFEKDGFSGWILKK